MNTAVIINPGTGPVERAYAKEAWKNIRAFRRDLGFTNPRVTIERVADWDEGDGRYGFRLVRGIRSCEVDMPGWPLERVRWMRRPEQNIWHFPRLYVEGSSWVWFYALSEAQRTLRDHDGSIEKRLKREERAADRELKKRPQCSACGTFRSLTSETDEDDNDRWRVRCYECEPRFSESKRFGRQAKLRLMPPGAPGGELCGVSFYGEGMKHSANDYCRLRRGHDGKCEGYWQVVEWLEETR